jgi:THAP4-like, heme-binding beta-barrel domain
VVASSGVHEVKIHEDLRQIAFLIGTWTGIGNGSYPTAAPFSYREEITFTNGGTPVLAYTQRTWHPEKGFAMHAEMGYWRSKGDGRVEVVLAQPTGLAEILEGRVDGQTIDLASTAVVKAATAKEVSGMERTFTVEGDELRYEVRMAAVGVPLTRHLTATLHRTA